MMIKVSRAVLLLWCLCASIGLTWERLSAQQASVSVPSGLITFSTAGTCPGGWTEYTAARGRYVVGLPSGGTITSTVGTALTNNENRADGTHTHTGASNSHTHTTSGGSHSHSGVFSSSSSSTDPFSFTALYYTPATTGFATTGITLGGATTGLAVSNTAAPNNVSGTNAPFTQYIACKKN